MSVKKIIQSIKDFSQRTDGASGIEYALVAAMVAVALAVFVPTISTAVTGIFNNILTALT